MRKYFFYIISLLLCFFFFLIYSYQSLQLYDAHETHGDLTSFSQAIWNTTKGRIMQSTFNYSVHNFWSKDQQSFISDNSNIFGVHFNPILFIFIPIYYLFSTPKTLLLIQSFLITVSGFIIFLVALRKLHGKIISFLIQLSFLIYFGLASAVLDEFHAYSLSIFVGASLIYFSKNKSWIYYFILFLLFSVQENTAVITIFYGLYLLVMEKNIKRGLLTIFLSIGYFFLATKLIIPVLSPFHYYMFDSIYGNPLGNSIPQIIINSFKNPYLFFSTLFTRSNVVYLVKFIIPTIPFSLFSPVMLAVSITGLAANLLSSSESLKSLSLHYESLSIPFLYYSLILGIENIHKLKLNKYITFALLIISILLSYKIFTSKRINKTVLTEKNYSKANKELSNLIKKIPDDSSVSTQDYASVQLSHRQKLYLFPVYYKRVDYLLLATNYRTWPLDKEGQNNLIMELKKDKNYRVIYESNNFILFKKQ